MVIIGHFVGNIGTVAVSLTIIALALGLFSLLFAGQILTWLNTPEESYESARAYLIITSAGLPFVFGYNAASSVLRGMGDSKNPLLFVAIAAVINLVLDIVFIVCFDMGAAGTALATIIGQAMSLVASVILLYRRRADFGFDFRLRSFRIDRKKLVIMMKIGIPRRCKASLSTVHS